MIVIVVVKHETIKEGKIESHPSTEHFAFGSTSIGENQMGTGLKCAPAHCSVVAGVENHHLRNSCAISSTRTNPQINPQKRTILICYMFNMNARILFKKKIFEKLFN